MFCDSLSPGHCCRPSPRPSSRRLPRRHRHHPRSTSRRSAAPRIPLALDRPGRAGRPRRRLRRRREESVHVLRRLRRQRRREDGQQRHDVRVDLRHLRRGVDRRPRARAVRSEHPLRRDRRSEQPADDVVRRRPVQEHRRRQDVHEHRIQGRANARARHRASARSEHVWIAVGGHLYGSEPRARRLHDDRRRQDVDEDALRRREHGRDGARHRPEQPAEPVGGDVPAPAHGVGLRRRRPGQRHLSEHRRRQDRGRR